MTRHLRKKRNTDGLLVPKSPKILLNTTLLRLRALSAKCSDDEVRSLAGDDAHPRRTGERFDGVDNGAVLVPFGSMKEKEKHVTYAMKDLVEAQN